MTAELNLTAEEITELKQFTDPPDIASAVQVATREYLQFAQRQALKTSAGRVEMQDNWHELELLEMRRPDEHAGFGAG